MKGVTTIKTNLKFFYSFARKFAKSKSSVAPDKMRLADSALNPQRKHSSFKVSTIWRLLTSTNAQPEKESLLHYLRWHFLHHRGHRRSTQRARSHSKLEWTVFLGPMHSVHFKCFCLNFNIKSKLVENYQMRCIRSPESLLHLLAYN